MLSRAILRDFQAGNLLACTLEPFLARVRAVNKHGLLGQLKNESVVYSYGQFTYRKQSEKSPSGTKLAEKGRKRDEKHDDCDRLVTFCFAKY